MASKTILSLPPVGSSKAKATHRFEEISQKIYETVAGKRADAAKEHPMKVSREAYAHFRQRAYKLLSYYVDNEFQEAFRWLLEMYGKAPKRSRGSVKENDFHLGLLAMTASAGQFMHQNKLRDLAARMKEAYEGGVAEAEFDKYVSQARRKARCDRVLVSEEVGLAIQQRNLTSARY